MHRLLAASLGLALAGPVAAAEFEGVIDSRISIARKGDEGGGTARLYVSRPGARMEMQIPTPRGPMRMTVIHLKSRPGVTYILDEERKTYSENEAHDSKGKAEEPEKVTVKKLPGERVAGYECVHALVTGEKGDRMEVWVSRAIGGAEAFWSAQAGEGRGTARFRGLAKAMRDAGLDGWPLRWRSNPGGESESTWEAIKVERKSVPASLFSLSGYTKTEHGMGQLTPEQRQRMEEARKRQQEAMKKMTPEQRKQMEEMMKSMQGGAAPKQD